MGSHSKKFAEREEEFISRSGIPIKRLYTPEDMSQFNYAEDLGYPGEYPFTRGIYPTMYRGRIWSQRQLVGLGSGEDGNKRLRSLIDQGMTGISVVCDINIIRATIQSLAAVFGGCQSLQPCAMDEAFAIPTERTAQLSLRTQQVIEHETGIANTIDPLGGSYFVESLTDQIEAKAREYLDKIDNMGGLITAMEKGFIQKELAESAHRHQEEIETKKRIIVGVNDHTIEEEPEMELYHPPPELKDNVIAIYRKLKKERDKQKVKEALDNLRRVAQGGDNLVPATVAAVKTYAVITEIVGVFQEVFGEYEPMSIF